jgi:PTH1 family peptidyl-tRNA hydrolase
VGLGNPGSEYANTRHNAGAATVELLASRYGERLKRSKERALVAEARVGDLRLALAFPQTYMNDSGLAVSPLVRRFGITDLERLVIVHDELVVLASATRAAVEEEAAPEGEEGAEGEAQGGDSDTRASGVG